jgi:lipopolysaccharide transport system permease protein
MADGGVTLSLGKYRHVLLNFIASDLKAKYRGSIAGYFWTLLEPLALVLTYYFLFTVIANVHRKAYPLSLLVGVLPWTYFASVVQSGAVSLTANTGLIQKVYLPRQIFLLSQVGSSVVVFLLSMLVVVPFLVYYRIAPNPTFVLLLPLAILMITAVAYGLGLVMACLNVLYRDVGYIIRVLLRLGLYLSPVIYTLDMVPEQFRDLYLLNPVSVCISLFRLGLLDETNLLEPWHVGAAIATCAIVFFGGSALFSRWEARVVKYL